MLDGGEDGVVEFAANFELGLAGDEIDADLEGACGAAVGDLNGDEDRNAEGDGEDVQEGEEPMAAGVAEDVPAEEEEEHGKLLIVGSRSG